MKLLEGKIVHLCLPKEWEAALQRGTYRAASLKSEGFIHFSTPEQALESAERYYREADALVALIVPVKWVKAQLKWEPGRRGEDFPHLYAALPLEKVETTLPVERNAEGRFIWA